MDKFTSEITRLLLRRLPCQEETITDQLLEVARVCLAISAPHRYDHGVAALQKAYRLVVTLLEASERVVAAFRPDETQDTPLRRRRSLGAVVEDEVLIDGADREWPTELGGGVGPRDMAVTGAVEVVHLLDIGDKQGAVAVEDVDDLELELPVLLRVTEIRAKRDGVVNRVYNELISCA